MPIKLELTAQRQQRTTTMLWLAFAIVLLHVVIRFSFMPIVNRLIPGVISLNFRGPGWLFPSYFRAHHLTFMIKGRSDRDRVFVKADRISFWLSPFHLFLGKIVLYGLRIEHPFLEYINRQNSFEKNHLLPPIGRVFVKNGTIINGRVLVTDETRTPRYDLELSKIEATRGSMDVALPAMLFFQIKRGQARFGQGHLEVRSGEKSGWLVLESTLAEVTSMGALPFFGSKFHLELAHKKTSRHVRLIEGQIAGSQEDKSPIPFDFELREKDYHLTMDLGVQYLIENVIRSARPNGINIKSGVIVGAGRFFDLIKKDYA